MAAKKRVLILCTGNSARSQMAQGLLGMTPGTASRYKARGRSQVPFGLVPALNTSKRSPAS